MLHRTIGAWVVVCACLFSFHLAAQQPQTAQQPQAAQQAAVQAAEPEAPRVVLQAETTASVLRLMKFSGALRDPAGNPRAGAVGLTFALYKDQKGGSPLWLEVQNAQLDEQGRYTVLLGSTKSEGLPLELFSSGEARWLGVQLNLPGEEEQARVLLVSVPYALKAADAETLGGKPPSAFLLADPVEADLRVRPDAGKEATKETPPRHAVQTLNFVQKQGASGLEDSSIFDNGFVGIGTAAPNVKLSLGTDLTAQKLALWDGPGDFYGLGLGSGRIAFHTSNTEKMTLTSGGRLGIGTVAPNVKLSLGTDITAQKLALYDGASDFYGLGLQSGRIVFHTGNTERMTLTSGGRLGIGTVAPNVKLSLGTDVAAQKLALYDGAGDFYGLGLEAGRIVFHTGNTEKMTLTAGGNVGIGTGTPTEKLEVAGNLKLSGSINGGLRVQTTAGTPNVIGGFSGNSVSGGVVGATIGGGGTSSQANSVAASFATVSGGGSNLASGDAATVGGGDSNFASALDATVSGGSGNSATGTWATVGGGFFNVASGTRGTVPGGRENAAAGQYSFAAGRRAKANHDGAFVWGDSTDADVASTVPNQFLVRASGGARFLGGRLTVRGRAQFVATGTVTTADSTITGSGTMFTTEVAVGDRITLPSDTRTVVAIASDTSLTVDTNFDNSHFGDSMSVLPALFRTDDSSGSVKLQVTGEGNVGIGTLAPSEKLHVVGNILATGSLKVVQSSGTVAVLEGGAFNDLLIGRNPSNVFRVDSTGKGFFNGGTQTGGADFAESVEPVGEKDEYQRGDVMVIGASKSRSVERSAEPYSTRVAGIYSTKPGVLATPHGMDDPRLARNIPLAIVGIVPCKASAENGGIEIGDLLVTSATPGHAMKGTDRGRMLGAIVGKALQPLREGAGVIEILVTLQ